MIPKSHPRYVSLMERKKIVRGLKKGITSIYGLIAQGRGEAFDYLIGERTTPPAKKAIKASAALLFLAKKPVISVNGNTTVLCAKDIANLAKEIPAKIEVNLFYRTRKREEKIKKVFEKFGLKIFGVKPDKKILGLNSRRAEVSSEGIWEADVVLIPLEDGDRAEALKKMGKKTIAIDLNPLSRTAKKSDITIIDNIVRAIPLLTNEIKKMKKKRSKLKEVVKKFNNKKNLYESLIYILKKFRAIVRSTQISFGNFFYLRNVRGDKLRR